MACMIPCIHINSAGQVQEKQPDNITGPLHSGGEVLFRIAVFMSTPNTPLVFVATYQTHPMKVEGASVCWLLTAKAFFWQPSQTTCGYVGGVWL